MMLGDLGGLSAIVSFVFYYCTNGVAAFRLESILAKVLYKEVTSVK
jgi:hypothetical protein